MYLTDFFPSSAIPIAGVSKLQGNVGLSGGYTTVPTPSAVAVNDLQVVQFDYLSNGSPDFSGSGFAITEGGWRIANFAFDGKIMPHVIFRKITAGNISSPFRVAQGSGFLTIRYCTYLLRGETLAGIDPIFGHGWSGETGFSISSTNSSIPRRQCWAPKNLALASELDLIAVVAGHTVDSTKIFAVPAESDRIVLSDRNTYTLGSGTAGNSGYVINRQLQDLAVNLNGTGHPLNGWTGSLVTINTAPSNKSLAFSITEQANTGRHGIYKDFTLEAGKVYDFAFNANWIASVGSGSNQTCKYLGYVGPDAVEHGRAGNQSYNVTGAVGSAVGLDDYIRHPDYDQNSFSGFGFTTTLRIRPTTTGVHRLWVCTIPSSLFPSLPGSLDSAVGDTRRVLNGAHISVVEVKDATWELQGSGAYHRNDPLYRDCTFRDRLLGVDRNAFLNHKALFLTLRGSTNKRPLVNMLGALHANASNAGNSRTIANQVAVPPDPYFQQWEFSDQFVGGWLGQKFYFEVTINQVIATQYFGYTLASIEKNFLAIGSYFPNNLQSVYLAGSDRKVLNTTVTSGLGTWSNGDVIGFLLDLTANQVVITRNGGAFATHTLSTDPRAACFPYKVMQSTLIDGTHNTIGRHTLNLRGPFSYKPVGAVAFDFDNELA